MSVDEIINKLNDILHINNKNDYKKEIIKQKTIKDAHIYCKINKLNGQTFGCLIEYYMINKFSMKKVKSSLQLGDAEKNNLYYEIKTSLGGKFHNKFNYVQIRLNHKIDYYIFLAYYIDKNNVNNCGELFIFKLNKYQVKEVVYKHGTLAHGTKNENKDENLYKEFAIRLTYNSKLWNILLDYRIKEFIL